MWLAYTSSGGTQVNTTTIIEVDVVSSKWLVVVGSFVLEVTPLLQRRSFASVNYAITRRVMVTSNSIMSETSCALYLVVFYYSPATHDKCLFAASFRAAILMVMCSSPAAALSSTLHALDD